MKTILLYVFLKIIYINGGDNIEAPLQCPLCQADLKSTKIPEFSKHYFGNREYLSKAIGIYNLQTDEFEAWECPECNQIIKEDNKKESDSNL